MESCAPAKSPARAILLKFGFHTESNSNPRPVIADEVASEAFGVQIQQIDHWPCERQEESIALGLRLGSTKLHRRLLTGKKWGKS